jgi:GNAT superfamily N-acetyltransferase
MSREIEVSPVKDRKDLMSFIRFPWKVYRDDPNWVPPLISERLDRLDPEKNSFFSHSEVELYLARRDHKPVGTIAAFVDHRSNDHLREQIGGFGFFEAIEDYHVAERLLDTACQTVRKWGMKGIKGPTNFGPIDEPGIVLKGADCPPALLEAHTPPYYQDFLERYGMTKFRDSYAWRVSLKDLGDLNAIHPQLTRVFNATHQRGGVDVRKVRLDRWDDEVRIARELFNATLQHLPDFVPMSKETFRRFADQMRPLLDPDLALFAEIEGKSIGFLVGIPDFNRVLIHLNGRLFPFGWLKLLWFRRRIDVISFKLFGVLEEYRRRGIDVLLYMEAVRAAVAKGYRWLDGSLTSEFNPTVVRLATRMGAEQYKLFRLYQLTF